MSGPLMPLIETQVRMQYKLLGHEGFYTRVRASNEEEGKAEHYLSGIEEILAWARPRSGASNLYISRNPFTKNGEVASINGFSIDVDKVREPKDRATTGDELRQVLAVAHRINGSFGLCATSGISGNGALLIFPFEEPITSDLEQFTAKAQRFEKQIKDKFETDEVRIDATNYAKAILRLMGSVNTKDADPRKWRYAKFLHSRHVFRTKRSPIRTGIEGVELSQSVSVLRLDGIASQTPGPGVSVPSVAPENKAGTLGPAARLAIAEESLRRLAPARRDNYDEWIKCGIALKEFGPAGLQIWREWSSKSPKYEPGDCENKWATFRADQALTVGTLKFWADSDDPNGERRTVQMPGLQGRGLGLRLLGGREQQKLWTPGDPVKKADATGTFGLGLSSGFKWLDSKLNGGYRPGVVYAVEATTNSGKSCFIIQAAQHCCEAGRKVLLVTTEASVEEVCQRYWACGTGIPTSQVSNGCLTEHWQRKLDEYKERFRGHKLGIWYTVSPQTDEIEHQINEFKPDIVLWDYFQHFETGTESRQIQLGSLARWFESTAIRTGTPFVVAAQLHERYDFKNRKRLPAIKDDIKDCKVLNDAAKTVIVIDWDQKEQKSEDAPVLTRIALEKNKGPMGETKVLLRREIPRFEEI